MQSLRTKQGLGKPRRKAQNKQLLDGAKGTEVDWAGLADMSKDSARRGGYKTWNWCYFIAADEQRPATVGPADLLLERTSESVYVLPYIKIGSTNDPLSRRKNLQTGSPIPLRLLTCLYGGAATERALHSSLATYRIPHTREWFDFQTWEIWGAMSAIITNIMTRQLATSLDADETRMVRIVHDVLHANANTRLDTPNLLSRTL